MYDTVLGMPHDHHDHSHHHTRHDHRHYHHAEPWQAAGRTRRAMAFGILLNIILVAVEYLVGWQADSLSLVADASHNLTDVTGLLLALGAVWMAGRLPSARYTYGMGGATIIAALANGVLLIFISGALAVQAYHRFWLPGEISSTPVIIVALIGMLINFGTAKLFHGHSHNDLNVRGAYLHMMGDAGISLSVALGALAMRYTGLHWIDPVLTLAIVLAIVASTWGLLRDSIELALQGVPRGIDQQAVRAYLSRQTGVTEVHELHIWGLSTMETALTVHLVMPDGHPGDTFLETVAAGLKDLGVNHATVQIETTRHHADSLVHAGR